MKESLKKVCLNLLKRKKTWFLPLIFMGFGTGLYFYQLTSVIPQAQLTSFPPDPYRFFFKILNSLIFSLNISLLLLSASFILEKDALKKNPFSGINRQQFYFAQYFAFIFYASFLSLLMWLISIFLNKKLLQATNYLDLNTQHLTLNYEKGLGAICLNLLLILFLVSVTFFIQTKVFAKISSIGLSLLFGGCFLILNFVTEVFMMSHSIFNFLKWSPLNFLSLPQVATVSDYQKLFISNSLFQKGVQVNYYVSPYYQVFCVLLLTSLFLYLGQKSFRKEPK